MKQDMYRRVVKRLESQIANERDWLSNLSNSSQLFGKLIDDLNWIGFYLYREGELRLGPFWGNPAVTRIAMGKGVCGTAASQGKTIIVPNVHEFPGHIVCDIISQSEIVVPLFDGDRLLGVLDVDSPTLERFNQEDQEGFEALVETLVKGTDWEGLK